MHTATPIENTIYRQLAMSSGDVSQLDLRYLDDEKIFTHHLSMYPTKTILYTFFDYDRIDYLLSVQKKKEQMEWILRYAADAGVENIIYVTYPGAFYDSVNIYLQHEGIIQQRIAASTLNYNFLGVHALCDFERQQHSLHKLYFLDREEKYLVPHSFRMVYALYLDDFMRVVNRLSDECTNKTYEAFSAVYPLTDFLELYGDIHTIRKWPNAAFHMYSYLIAKRTPCVVDLSWRPVHKMHRKKLEKDLGVNLISKINTSPLNRPIFNTATREQRTSFSLRELQEPMFI